MSVVVCLIHQLEIWQLYSQTLSSGFHYETDIGISPYRTLVVVWTAMHGGYVRCDFIMWENTNVVHFSGDMWKYSTCKMNIQWTSAAQMNNDCLLILIREFCDHNQTALELLLLDILPSGWVVFITADNRSHLKVNVNYLTFL